MSARRRYISIYKEEAVAYTKVEVTPPSFTPLLILKVSDSTPFHFTQYAVLVYKLSINRATK